MTTTTNEATNTLQSLREKLDGAQARADEIRAAIRDISFEAHSGDEAARKKLDTLIADENKQLPEIRSLGEAIDEAQRRVTEAQAAESDDVARDRAEKALILLDAFAKRGEALDKALEAFIEEYTGLSRDFRQLDALGYAPTSFPLVKINMARAVATKLQFTDLRQEFLAPNERRDFVTVIKGWSLNVQGRVTARLARSPAVKAA